MPFYRIKSASSIRGEILLPGDKSIAHRSVIISSIARGNTYIYNFPKSQDCLRTLYALSKLGVKISRVKSNQANLCLCVKGKGLYSLKRPSISIFAGNSGTTIRLLLGILAGQRFRVTLTGGRSLSRRPMRRVTEPLRRMGADIHSKATRLSGKKLTQSEEEYPPLVLKGCNLHSIAYRMPIASAQVKSALLLAGLYAKGVTRVIELLKTRDHTERMLEGFCADIKIKNKTIFIRGHKELVSPGIINIPGDISSASFFITAATLLPNSHLKIRSVGINPTRMGVIRVLERMGADIKIMPISTITREPTGHIIVKSTKLRGTEINASEVGQLIDELPILMLAACFARGRTVIYGVEELRFKETDRINSMQDNLRKMGAKIYIRSYRSGLKRLREKIIIQGPSRLQGVRVSSFGDHRTAMSMIIAGLTCDGYNLIDDIECINKSFPDFLKTLTSVTK